MMTTIPRSAPPRWQPLAIGLGLAWSLYGIFQFWAGTTSSIAGLISAGMTPEQAALYHGLPTWMTIAFAIGVFGGAIGAGLLLARHRLASAVLAASLAGYVVLFIGDITEGVFAAFGTLQVIVLTLAVAIAAALLWLAHRRQA